MSLIASFILLLGMVGIPTQTVSAADLQVNNNGDCSDATGSPYCTIGAALEAAGPGDTITVAAGTYPLSTVLNLNKAGVTLRGVDNPVIQVSGAGDRFHISATGVTIDGFTIEKTDKTGEQNIIRIAASNTSITNNEIFGRYVFGDGDVSRAMVINAGAFTGLNISGNTIHDIRQPAYISGVHSGTISNNHVYLTRGWVVEGGNLTFTGNTWGTGPDANIFDIAILAHVGPGYYTDILAMSAANNGAFIEDQRTTPATLSDVYVDGSVAASGTGTASSPKKTIGEGVTRVVTGGTVHVAAGSYTEQVNINKSLHLVGAGSGSSVIQAPTSLPAASSPASAIVIVSGSGVDAELTGFTVAGPGPTSCGSIRAGIYVFGGANANIHHNTIQDVRDAPFGGCQNGVAIAVGRQFWSTSGTATISDNSITGYQKGGIVVDNTGSNATITNNIVTGAGTTNITAQNGIQISRGATATLSGNTVTGNSYFKAGDTTWSWGAAGILLYQSGPVTMAGGNTVAGNDQNVSISGPSGALLMGTENLGPSSAPAEFGTDIVNFNTHPIDATSVTFTGAADGFAIEDRVWHVIDEAGLGLVTWTPDNVYVTPATEEYQVGSIQRGIGAVTVGGTVNVSAGTFTENILLDRRVSLVGSGPATIIANAAGGDVYLGTIQIAASGLSNAEPILLKDLSVHPNGRAGISIGRFTQSTGANVSYLALEDVDVTGTNLNPCTEQERGLYVDNTSSLLHLSVEGGSFNNLAYGWYFQKAVSADASTVQYVTVDGTSFNHNNLKGMYIEKLEDATFTNISVDGNGFSTAADLTSCSYFLPNEAGIDINLKAGNYQNITFVNPVVTNNALGGAKEGFGLAVKARTDGAGYGLFPATLDNVQITGAIVTGNERGIRIGEPGKGNAGPTNVKIHTSYIAGNVKTYSGTDGSAYGGVINQALALVDATTNWWGDASGPGPVGPGTGDAVTVNVTYTPWLCVGTDISTDPGFQTTGQTDCSKPVVTGVAVSPSPVYLNALTTITAVADDSTTGNSRIDSAEYSLNDGPYQPMAASDGTFDSPVENVKATFTAATLGSNKVCVRAKDAWGEVSDPACTSFSAGYVFTPFYQPIDMNAINLARAGQTIPVKWRLTDANGLPISDPSSFAGLFSATSGSCGGIAATDAIETYSSTSGLQYLGDGYWQYNWKTLKSYSGCRIMYVKFLGGQQTQNVTFNFK